MLKKNLLNSAVQAVALTAAFAGTAMASEVVLKSQDGNIEVKGSLLAVEEDHYRISTAIGELSVSKMRVMCEGAECNAEEDFQPNFNVLANDSITQTLVPLALEGFAASQSAQFDIRPSAKPGAGQYGRFIADDGYGAETVKFQTSPSTTADALSGLGDGQADIVLMTRRVTPDEARMLAQKGVTDLVGSDKETLIAQETLAAVVHPGNPVSEIGIQQLRDVLRGAITNWNELGGPDAEIRIVRTDMDAAAGSMAQQVVFGGVPGELVEPSATASSDEATSALVGGDPHAIGLVGLSALPGAKPLALVSQCGVVSHPTDFHAKSGDYPLVRPIVMYHHNAADNEHVADFLAYTNSEDFTGLIEKAGYLSDAIVTQDHTAQTYAPVDADLFQEQSLAEFATELAEYDRLSTTFKFRTGSSKLDDGGVKDMAKLVEFLSQQPAGTSVTFVGFSDSVGAASNNRSLSLKRAEQLEDLTREMMPVDAAARIEFVSKGYGEIRPRACNTTVEGRHLNRRVEVWISRQNAS